MSKKFNFTGQAGAAHEHAMTKGKLFLAFCNKPDEWKILPKRKSSYENLAFIGAMEWVVVRALNAELARMYAPFAFLQWQAENNPQDSIDEITQDGVTIRWVELGEGWGGDYNEDDETDDELLRFDIEKDGEILDDGSYCTAFPVKTTPRQRLDGLIFLMSHLLDYVKEDNYKHRAEEMSWIDPTWVDKTLKG